MGGRPALVRPPVPALHRLPAQPAGGAPGGRGRQHAQPEEPGADLALLGRPGARPADARMRPRRSASRPSAQLIQGRLGRPADRTFADACHVATGGNPLLLTELLRAVESEGIAPEAAHAGAVEDLGPRAVRARCWCGCRACPPRPSPCPGRRDAGGGAELRHIARARRPGRGRRRARARVLARAEILRPEPPIGFVHPLVRRRSTGTSLPASGSGATPWRPGSSARRARRATSSPPSCWRCRRWARTGLRTSSSTPPARRW